jgi:hypothetical protein
MVLLARRRQDSQCTPGELQEDGRRGGQAEGKEAEGGGAGDASVAARSQKDAVIDDLFNVLASNRPKIRTDEKSALNPELA